MNKITVDARGCACPEPVLKTKKAAASGASQIDVLVDNNTAVENIKRFATALSFKVAVEKDETNAEFVLHLTK